MVNSLTGSESPLQMSAVTSPVTPLGRSKSSSLRRRKRPGRQTSVEKHNGEVSTSASGKTKITACRLNMYVHCFCVFVFFHPPWETIKFLFTLSDGGGGTVGGCVELEVCPCGGSHSWLVPAMLSPPESLLMSCIRRGNFMEAHQVCVASWTKKKNVFTSLKCHVNVNICLTIWSSSTLTIIMLMS